MLAQGRGRLATLTAHFDAISRTAWDGGLRKAAWKEPLSHWGFHVKPVGSRNRKSFIICTHAICRFMKVFCNHPNENLCALLHVLSFFRNQIAIFQGHWLPLFIHEQHSRAAFELLSESLHLLAKSSAQEQFGFYQQKWLKTHKIHVWCLYLPIPYAKCRQIYHTWTLWEMIEKDMKRTDLYWKDPIENSMFSNKFVLVVGKSTLPVRWYCLIKSWCFTWTFQTTLFQHRRSACILPKVANQQLWGKIRTFHHLSSKHCLDVRQQQ